MFGTFFVIAIVVVGGQLAYRYLVTKQRSAATVAATAATGLAIAAESDDAPPLPFDLFHRGHGRRVRNRVWDPKDPNASVFDYQYTVTSGTGQNRSSRTHRQTCAVYSLSFSAPSLALWKQGFFDKVAVSFGGTDIVIGDAPFDELYRVKCQDEAFARAVLDQRFVSFLLHEGQGGEVRVEMSGPHLLLTTGDEIPPDQFDDLLALGHRLIDHLPAALTGGPPSAPPMPRPTQQAMQQWDPHQGPMAAPDAAPMDRPRSTPIE